MLPYRVLGLFTFSVYGYELAQRVLRRFGVNLAAFAGAHPTNVLPFAHKLALVVLAGYLVHLVTWLADWVTVAAWFALFLSSKQLRNILKRVVLGKLSHEHRLGDVLIADTLVSYASVLSDFALAIVLMCTGDPLDRKSVHPFVLTVASLPIGIRIKQCFHDYRRTGDKTHLLNLLKYVTSNVPNVLRIQMLEFPQLAKYLRVALAVSTIYSLVWDVWMDWQVSKARKLPFEMLQAAVAADVLLRFAWILHNPSEYRIFTLQCLELARRCMWVLFRVDHEQQDSLDIAL